MQFKKLTFCFYNLILASLFFVTLQLNAHASVLFSDGFEFGQAAPNLSALEYIPEFRAKWNGDNEEGDGTLASSSARVHTGNFSGFVNTGPGASTHFEANYNYGSNFYVEMWIYPLSNSTLGSNNKLIYAYTSATGPSVWCLKVTKNRVATGSCAYSWETQNDGWAIHYVGPGAATPETGLNNLLQKYLHEDRWNRIVFHINQASSSRTDLELWIDNGDGNGLEKTGEVSVTSPGCVAQSGGVFSTGRLKYGLMSSTLMEYHFDDIRVVNSSSDIDWSSASVPDENPEPSDPVIATANLNSATVGSSYSSLLEASNGSPPYSWDIVSGILPDGINIDTSSGLLSGTPSNTGSFTFTVRVTDTNYLNAQREFVINVEPQSNASLIFEDNFETDKLNEWINPWGEIGSSDSQYGLITQNDSIEGNYSFQETIPSGSRVGGTLAYTFPSNEQRKIYTGFYYKCSDPWDPTTANKLSIVIAGEADSPTQADLQVILQIAEYAGSRLGQFMVCYSNFIDNTTNYYNLHQNVGTPIIRETNRWYKIELIADAGTPGNSDGSIKLYIDDELKCDYENINLLPLTNYANDPLFNWFILTNYALSTDINRTSWYDDIVLATDRIAADDSGSSTIAIPGIPPGLTVTAN